MSFKEQVLDCWFHNCRVKLRCWVILLSSTEALAKHLYFNISLEKEKCVHPCVRACVCDNEAPLHDLHWWKRDVVYFLLLLCCFAGWVLLLVALPPFPSSLETCFATAKPFVWLLVASPAYLFAAFLTVLPSLPLLLCPLGEVKTLTPARSERV